MTRYRPGAVFGRLTLINKIKDKWFCQCSCGKTATVWRSNLAGGYTKSCGCLRRISGTANRHYRHGHTSNNSPAYRSYTHARERCNNLAADNYIYYGGRGIEFRFKSFTEFFAELGPRPEGMTLDRINPDGHYEAGNVRWATRKEQSANRRYCR